MLEVITAASVGERPTAAGPADAPYVLGSAFKFSRDSEARIID